MSPHVSPPTPARTARRAAWGLAARLGVAALVLVWAVEALGRLGGGDSFHGGGGGHSSGGGGGGGGGEQIVFFLLELLLRFVLHYPYIGIPTVVLVIVGFYLLARRHRLRLGALRRGGGMEALGRAPRAAGARTLQRRTSQVTAADWAALRDDDPNFSRPLFADFVVLLYARAQALRPTGDPAPIGAYLAPEAWAAFAGEAVPTSVDEVVVGAARVIALTTRDPRAFGLTVAIEASYREDGARRYSRERWTLRRKRGVLSRGPDDIRALRCPSCGSAEAVLPDGRCPACRNTVNRGEFAWTVTAVHIAERKAPPPLHRELGGAEPGTGHPTVYAPDLAAAWRTLRWRHPQFSPAAFEQHVRAVFERLQAAWSSRDWLAARPYETDALFQTHRFWIERYKREGLTNRLDDIAVESVVPVKVEFDAYFETITVRIFASMRDYTVDESGRVVSGDPKRPRHFSEYWTFVRRAGREFVAKPPDQCPSCGAALDINQAGECAYCKSNVVGGDFGWVLSAIEQDEVYAG